MIRRFAIALIAMVGIMAITNRVSAQTTTTTTPVSSAPAKDRSTAVTVSTNSVQVLVLADGVGNTATAFAHPLYTVAGTTRNSTLLPGPLQIVATGAVSISGSQAGNVWAGTGLSYNLFKNSGGWSLTGYVAWKGLNLSSGFEPAKGLANLVIGAGINIPIK